MAGINRTTPISIRSNLDPLAAIFIPQTSRTSSTLNPEAPTFSPAVVSSETWNLNLQTKTSVPQSQITCVHEPAAVKSQTAAMDDSCFEDEDSDSTAIVNLVVMSSECSVTQPSVAQSESETSEPFSLSSIVSADEIEYNNQRTLIRQDPDIHHFNWMGQGVMCRTSTPAAVSLTVALTPASARYYDNENLRTHTVLREAMLMIDPVVYYGDINTLKDLRGERLREEVIGSAAVFYTPFGWWKDDSYGEDDERPLKDELNMTRYMESTTVVNGWLENGAPTRQEYWRDAEEAYYLSAALRKKMRDERKLLGNGNTPLRSAMTANGEELRIAARHELSTDASGLLRAAVLSSQATTTPSPARCVIDDDLFKNANWADDLNDEDVVDNVNPTHTSPSKRSDDYNDLFKNANWADDIDDEDEILTVAPVPIALSKWSDDNDDLFKNANWADDLDDDEVVPVANSFSVSIPSTNLALTTSKEQTRTRSNELLPPVNLSQCKDHASMTKIPAKRTTPNFRPIVSGNGGCRFRPVVSIPQHYELHTKLEQDVLAPSALLTFSIIQALEPCSNETADAEEEEMYGSGSAATSSGSPSVVESFVSSSTSLSLYADQKCALQGYSQDDYNYQSATAGLELGESVLPLTLNLPFRTTPVRYSMAETQTLPVRPKEIAKPPHEMTSADYIAEGEALMASIRLRFSPESAETSRILTAFAEEEEPGSEGEGEEHTDVLLTLESDPEEDELAKSHELVAEGEDSIHGEGSVAEGEVIAGSGSVVEDVPITSSERTTPKQVLTALTMPTSPTRLPSNLRDRLPLTISPLKEKKNRSPCKALSVEQDHSKVFMPKFSLVPTSMESNIRHHAEKLDEIEERNEEDAASEAVSEASDHFAQTTVKEVVNAKVDPAVSQSYVPLKRSPCIGNLAHFVEDDSYPELVTPEHSPVLSPYKRPASNTPNAMLGKKVKFSLPYDDEDASSSEEVLCTRGIGAIFEDDEEDDEDDNSILFGVVVCEGNDNVPLQHSVTSRFVGNPPEVTTSSGSASVSDDVFTAQSKESTASTTVGGSEEGSPSPSIIPQPAERPVFIAEPSSGSPVRKKPETLVREQPTLQKHKLNWSSIKTTLSKKPTAGGIAAANAQVKRSHSRTPSWTKVENKLRKLPPPVNADPEKKKSGMRKALKKAKNAFVKGLKTLA